MQRLALVFLLVATPLSAATFRSHDGVTLHYDVVGNGEPVVMLSGGPGFSPDYLRPLAENLDGHSFVLLHQRGTGRSILEKYDASTLALPLLVEDVDALRRELGQERLTIVAHSFGGILSMMYAQKYPERIRALALIDSGGPTLQSVPKFTANLNARFTEEENARIKEWSAPERMKADRTKAVLEITKAKTPAYFADRTKAHVLVEMLDETSFSDRMFWSVVPQMMALDVRAGLDAVQAPVLVLHGAQDPLESAAEVHAAFPRSRLVMIEGAGHFPWLEQPEVVYDELSKFLVATGGGRQAAGESGEKSP
jgi:proline iminopeptidase